MAYVTRRRADEGAHYGDEFLVGRIPCTLTAHGFVDADGHVQSVGELQVRPVAGYGEEGVLHLNRAEVAVVMAAMQHGFAEIYGCVAQKIDDDTLLLSRVEDDVYQRFELRVPEWIDLKYKKGE